MVKRFSGISVWGGSDMAISNMTGNYHTVWKSEFAAYYPVPLKKMNCDLKIIIASFLFTHLNSWVCSSSFKII